jgi:tetratricopeptide (TPR) repeat protein
MKTRTALVLVVSIVVSWTARTRAADQWIEVKSPHFTVISNAGDRAAQRLAWQLEQVRSAMQGLWAWARIDLDRPMCVIAVKDEGSMRQLAPGYWEERGGIRPASVWVSGPDQHYLTIRTDVRADDNEMTNPHITAYFSYIGLIMGQNLDPDLPLWFSRGLAGVLSNTLVRDDYVLVGAPIRWELERLREGTRLSLAKLTTITRRSPEFTQASLRERFDAQAWAFVHFLMFAEQGKRVEALNRFAQLVTAGTDAQAALTEAIGPVDALAAPFVNYIDRSLYSFAKVKLDVSVDRERLPVRKLAPAESAAVRASFHAVMRRPVEARALIAEAQKADPAFPESYVAEALLLDAERKPDEARAAFAKGVELGSTSSYAHYRLAGLMWSAGADRDTLSAIEKHLGRAVALNTRFAAAYSWLGEIRAELGTGDSMGVIGRAISLEPREASHRLRAAYALARQQKLDEAETQAKTALSLADTEQERQRAQELLERIAKAKAGGN